MLRDRSKNEIEKMEQREEELILTGGELIRFEPKKFKNFSKIVKIDLTCNGIFTLPEWIKDCTNAESLRLDENPITEISDEFMLPPALVEFCLCKGGLTWFPMLPDTITKICLSNNNIPAYDDPEQHPHLTHLDLSHNNLNHLPNRLSRSLVHLIVTNNYLQRLPRNLPGLIEKIDFRFNLIKGLPTRLPVRLVSLRLGWNHISSLTGYKFPESLTELQLQNNLLTSFKFNLSPNLVHLNLSRNRISEILPDLNIPDSLEVLLLYGNSITSLHNLRFTNNSKLRTLNVSDNLIETLPTSLPENLKQLYCSHCNLVGNLNLSKYTELVELEVDGNFINEIQGPLSTRLTSLICSNNNLTKIDSIEGCKELRYLDLSFNFLDELPTGINEEMKYLAVLKANGNHITTLPNSLPDSLAELVVNDNQINKLPPKLPKELSIFRIHRNQLKTFGEVLLTCDKLRLFNFVDNPLIFVSAKVRRFLQTIELQNFMYRIPLEGPTGEIFIATIDELPAPTIYEDPETVHRRTIRKCVWDSISNLQKAVPLKECKPIDETLADFLNDETINETARRHTCEHLDNKGTMAIIDFETLTLNDLLRIVWHIIETHPQQKVIKEILNEDLQEKVCETGYISRLVNCLANFSEYVKIDIPVNEQYANIVARSRLNMGDLYDPDKHRDVVKREMEERGASPRTVIDWISEI